MARDITTLAGIELVLLIMSQGGNTDGTGKTRIEVGS
jgi:hypothetical protein